MHFLLTNDDGIDAPGLAALENAVRMLPDSKVTVVAPDGERSMCGHRVTTREPIAVEHRGDARYAITAMPADCVRVALFALGVKPDVVISGVNAGGNMGQDIVVSGTVAAAREAAYHGIRSLALSHYLIKGVPLDWERTSRWSAELLCELLAQPLDDGEFWNVNLPHPGPEISSLPERVIVPPAREPLLVGYAQTADASGRMLLQYNVHYADRPAPPMTDVGVCFSGRIAVSRLQVTPDVDR